MLCIGKAAIAGLSKVENLRFTACFFAPGKGAKYCYQRVCMSACPLANLKNVICKLHKIVTSGRGSVLL